MEALSGGSIECVKLLLDRGAKINQQDKVSIFQIRARGIQCRLCCKHFSDANRHVNIDFVAYISNDGHRYITCKTIVEMDYSI